MHNNKRVLVFGGTNEGRALCEHLHQAALPFTVCVATAYGHDALSHLTGADIHTGRLDAAAIGALLPSYSLVVDATHPYAGQVTANLRQACTLCGIPYVRILRPSLKADAQYFDTIPALCAYLASTQGAVLVTTGSKELQAYTAIPDFAKRLYVRVLPSAASIQACLSLGIPAAHIIAMQGPFGQALNQALLTQIDAKFLVTKESGAGGGYAEKIAAAKALSVTPLVVGRPTKESGYNLLAVIEKITQHFQADARYFPLFFSLLQKQITVIGGGEIALRRITALLPFSPSITVIAPTLHQDLLALTQLRCIKRSYESHDIDGAFLVLAATNNPQVNQQIVADCRAKSIPVNRCDQAKDCDFYFPALFENNQLLGGLIAKSGNHTLVKKTATILRTLLNKEEA